MRSRSVPLSVFIIAKDEAARLPVTLSAVGFADEIVVVDSGSEDATREIAEAAGARVAHRDWTGYGPQKVFAESLCRNDWVLNLDADEVVSDALAAEIVQLFLTGSPAPGAYTLPILNVYPGETSPRPFANDYRVVRLYHRSIASYRDHPLFDRVDLVPGHHASHLRGPVLHHPLTSWAHFVEKENRYTSFQAENARPRPGLSLRLRLVAEFPYQFLKFYVFRRHVFGGWKGFFFALSAAYARTLRIAKMIERSERRKG